MNLTHTGKGILKGEDRLQSTNPHSNRHSVNLNINQSKKFKESKNESSSQEHMNGKQDNSYQKQKEKPTTTKGNEAGSVKTKVKSTSQVKNVKHSKYEGDKKCNIKEIAHNTTLHSGMNAGNFKVHGKSNNITHCAELCCQDRLCDLALIMTGRCYTVQCYSMTDCQSKADPEDEVSDVVIAYLDNPSEKLNIKQGEHRMYHVEISKKTVVPNPNEGKHYLT